MGEEFESVTTQLPHIPRPQLQLTRDNFDLCMELMDAPYNDPALIYEVLGNHDRIPW